MNLKKKNKAWIQKCYEFEKKNNRNFKIKSVLKKLDVTPLKKTTIKFLNWFSEYNIIPKGMALKLVLLNSNALEKLQKDTCKIFETNIKKNSIKLSEEQKKSLKKMNVFNHKFLFLFTLMIQG